jgi:hypothetical protein
MILADLPHREQDFRACRGINRLSRGLAACPTYGDAILVQIPDRA